jgi:SPP1 gp7 family putative phage head morphogenesis protein
MVTIDPHDGSVVDDQVAAFHGALMTALNAVLERTAKHIDPSGPVQSSNIMRTFWKGKVNGLVDKLEAVVIDAADRTRMLLQSHVDTMDTRPALTADAFVIPSPVELFAEIYLRSRRGFLMDLGTDAWNIVRGELIAGMNDGEGIGELRSRVMSVADVAQPRAERIARTEVVGATNAGAIEQVRASKLDSTKTWLATNDKRTRKSHRDVDGTTVRLDETFLVGGVRMDRPHDPTAPADEVIQCRCTLTFEIGDDALTAAAFGKPDQARDYHGRWGHGGSKDSALTGDDALEHVKGLTKSVGYDQYDRLIAIKDYADSGYGPVNDGLRYSHGDAAEIGSHRANQIKEIDGIFADTPGLEKPIATYRGMRDYKNIFGVSNGQELVGKTLTDQGFMSTSALREVADSFASGSKAAIFTIHSPVGTKAVHVGKATNIAKKGEGEILFNRGSSMKITKVTTGSNGTLEIEAEL